MKIIKLLLGCIFFISCNRENENYVLSTKTWKEGEVIKYWVTLDEFLVTDQGLVPKNNLNYEIDLSILKISDSIEIVWQQYYPDGSKKNATFLDSLNGDTLNFVNGLKVRYLLTKEGKIAEIINWSEIDSYMTHVIDTLFKSTKSKLSPIKTEELKQTMISMAKDRKQIKEGKTTRDHQIFHHIYGISIPIEDSINKVYAELMGHQDTMRVSYLGKEGTFIHFMLTSTMKNCEFDSFATQSMNELGQAVDETFDMTDKKFNVSDTIYVKFDKQKSLPVILRSVRWTVIDSFKVLSEYYFEMK